LAYVTCAFLVLLQASSAYSAGPHHALFSQSLSSIYKQDVLSGSTDFLRVDGIPVSNAVAAVAMCCRRAQRLCLLSTSLSAASCVEVIAGSSSCLPSFLSVLQQACHQ
jgi:hypothetical protein